MSRFLSTCRCAVLRRTTLLSSIALLFLTPSLNAQDAVRPSLAGEQASEARRQSIENIPYNLQIGEIRFRLSATAGIEYNDNIDLAESNERDDLIFRPQINLHTLWPITQLNTIRIDLGIGYAFYFQHSENNTNGILLAPGSQIAFDVFVGDFRINFHDRFSLEQDPVSEIGLSDVSDYGRFQNTVGVTVLWDLNAAVATFGYDHYTFIATNDEFSYLDRNAEILSGTVFVAATSTTGIGVEGSLVFTSYDENFLNDSTTGSAGLFMETQISNYIKLRIAGGYQGIWFDNDGFVGDNDDLSDWYANLLLTHRLNSIISHSFSAGHESQLGVNSNYIMLNYVRHTVNWNIFRNTLLSTELFFEDADESGGFAYPGFGLMPVFFEDDLQRFGGAITVGYQLTQHVTLGARYQYTNKDSDLDFRDYEQNRVSFDATYSF